METFSRPLETPNLQLETSWGWRSGEEAHPGSRELKLWAVPGPEATATVTKRGNRELLRLPVLPH